MAKHANPGELRTTILIERPADEETKTGYDIARWVNVFESKATMLCKWQNAHGTEVIEAKKLDLREPATLTMRYTPKITPQCRIRKFGAQKDESYEIISIDDVEDRHEWLEVKIQRKVAAK